MPSKKKKITKEELDRIIRKLMDTPLYWCDFLNITTIDDQVHFLLNRNCRCLDQRDIESINNSPETIRYFEDIKNKMMTQNT